MESTNRKLVVIASGVGWDGVKGSERQLAEALTPHGDVLWVDPPVSPVTPARYRGIAPAARRTGPWLRPVSDRLWRLTPVGPPGWTRPGVRTVTWPLVRAQIRWALRKLGRSPAVVVACTQHDLLGHWGPGVVNVLYGTDDWVAGAGLMRQDPRRVLAEERVALGRADVVLTVGPELAARWRAAGAGPHEFPNGCDAAAYSAVPESAAAPLPESIPSPVAGVVGQLTERIDADLLVAVAESGLGVLLVGPRAPGWGTGLLALPGVHHVDAVPFEQLPRWLARMDVGLTPYADTAFNRASFPLKTLEYLAAGLPVVSTGLPASDRLARQTSQIWLADAPAEFAAAAWEASSVRHVHAVRGRMEFAAQHSWSARAEEFAALTGLALSRESAVGGRSVVDGGGELT